MLINKLLLVVGAGASSEVGLPVGSGLAKEISDRLSFSFHDDAQSLRSGDKNVYRNLKLVSRSLGKELNTLIDSSRKIARGIHLSGSVDEFINKFDDDDDVKICAKIAICASIFNAERSSRMHFDKDAMNRVLDTRRFEGTWYNKFFRIVSEGVKKSKVDNIFGNLYVVCFNYDRCLEHYMKWALVSAYDLPEAHAEKIVEGMKIVHPYGSLGNLYGNRNSSSIPFGATGIELSDIYVNINTFSEQINDDQIKSKIVNYCANASKALYIGFSYGVANMQLMDVSNFKRPSSDPIPVYGTAYGMSDDDISVVRGSVMQNFGGRTHPPVIENIMCSAFLDRFSKSIT